LGAQLGLQITLKVPRELGGVIIAFIILFVATDNLFLGGINWVRDKIAKIKHKKAIKEGSD
jgi:ABC-type uncharacterized transport system permease subunit